MLRRIFQAEDGHKVLIEVWDEDEAETDVPMMRVCERVYGGEWGMPLAEIGNEDE